jgi:hypothetical protein
MFTITLKNYMNIYNFKIHYFRSKIINYIQIDHIWIIAPTQYCHSGSTKAYWTNYKPISLAFQLPNSFPQFIFLFGLHPFHNTIKIS